MATIVKREAVAAKAKSAWASANSAGTEYVPYAEVTLAADGSAWVQLKDNNGVTVAHVHLSAAEVAALGQTIALEDATAKASRPETNRDTRLPADLRR